MPQPLSTPRYVLAALLVWACSRLVFALAARDYRRSGRVSPGVSVSQLLVFVLVCPVMGYLGGLAPWPRPRGNLLVYWSAITLACAAFLVCLGGMAYLGWRRTFGLATALEQRGLYRHSRNPQIAFGALAMAGFGLASFSWNGLVFALLFPAVAHAMVRAEEEHLRRVCGESYLRYCERTPRYLGWSALRRRSDG